ncbi:hypothetical protein, partial [Kitasatospora arboriphila]|uniref:hypothetical protein n=1 Tax=Kitasatospora arboriphila TaxID=258052 RepID=UPI0031D4E0DB
MDEQTGAEQAHAVLRETVSSPRLQEAALQPTEAWEVAEPTARLQPMEHVQMAEPTARLQPMERDLPLAEHG